MRQLFAGRSYGPISIGGAPLIFRDFDHWKKYTESKLFEELAAGYQKGSGGNSVVAITYYGNRQTTSNKALNKPEVSIKYYEKVLEFDEHHVEAQREIRTNNMRKDKESKKKKWPF